MSVLDNAAVNSLFPLGRDVHGGIRRNSGTAWGQAEAVMVLLTSLNVEKT